MLHPKDTDGLNGYKNKIQIYGCLQETHFTPKDTYRLKVRRRKTTFHEMGNKRKVE